MLVKNYNLFFIIIIKKVLDIGGQMNRFFENFLLKTTTKIILDCIMLVFALAFTFITKYEGNWINHLSLGDIFVYILISFTILFLRKTDYKSWSFLNTFDIAILGIDITFINLLFFLYNFFLEKKIRYDWLLINIIFSCFFLFMERFSMRFIFFRNSGKEKNGKKTLIVGAGNAADTLIREYKKNPNLDFRIVGLVDDNPSKSKFILHNYKVLGNRYDIPEIVEKLGVENIIIAIPSADSIVIKEIYDLASNTKATVKILPSYNEILENKSFSSQIRDVEVEDLLGRDPVEIDTNMITSYIEGKTVFVTGGAGSIGSELCRQIAKHNPKLIVCIDINENLLYFLELEIKRNMPYVKIISEICNIREKTKVEYLFDKYKPQLVYHAAAHKHVPLMEHNPEEAIKNNIFGTKNVIDFADKYNVERFVLISTDKAVNPTNIMGATKRATELILEAKAKVSQTKFMAVRFGNVLGSNGSVIPIFKKLISEGKDLTVTHPEITRYFMTIPEASQLVLEAGSLGQGGEVFVLDMGKPVKIIDLAKNLIKLSGLTLGVDINIQITGLRPGEKLYEELLYDVSIATKTSNKKIFVAKLRDENVPIEEFLLSLTDVVEKGEFFNIRDIMKKYVVTYKEVDYGEKNS